MEHPQTIDDLRWRVEELEGLLIERPGSFAKIGLTVAQADLAGLLLSRQLVTLDTWNIARGREYIGNKMLSICVHHLRVKLAPHGISIKTDYGRGYFMEPADKERLRTLEF